MKRKYEPNHQPAQTDPITRKKLLRSRLQQSLLLGCFLLLSGLAKSATYYINDGTFVAGDWCTAAGNDITGTGSASAPFATLANTLTVVGAGDSILVDHGIYSNELNLTIATNGLYLIGFNPGLVTFQLTAGTSNFLTIKKNGVTVENLTISGYNSTTAAQGKAITIKDAINTLIYNCVFTGNSSAGGEAAVYATNTTTLNTSATIQKCAFIGNIGAFGGAISVTANTVKPAPNLNVTIDSCYFENNVKSSSNGGALILQKGPSSIVAAKTPKVILTNSTFGVNCVNGGNQAARGGAIYVTSGSGLNASNCTFTNNAATDGTGPDGGGAIWADFANISLADCKFESNTANTGVSKFGGAIYAAGGASANNLTIDRSAFIGNTSNEGGAIYIGQSTAALNNCLFYGNTASLFGGGIALDNANASLTLYNGTFSNNTTAGAGRGGAIDGNSYTNPATIKNSILYGDGSQLELAGGANINVSWSIIGPSSVAGADYTSVTGNSTADPLFTNSASNDYTLSSNTSPAFNTGNTDGGLAPTDDINSITRVTLEMGCYAFGSSPLLKWTSNDYTNVATISGPSAPICAGNAANLTASPSVGYTYSWSSTPAGFSGNTATVTDHPSVTTLYQVTISGPCSDYGTDTLTVFVNGTAPVVTPGGPTTFCQGGNVVLTSNSAVANHWSTGAVTQSISVTASGTYTDTVNTGGCATFSSGTVITVNPSPPVPTITASGPTTFCTGDSVILTSSSAINNSWSNGALTQSITLYASGTFTDTVTASGCSSHSTITTVTANPAPATPVITPSGPTTFCSGGNVVLTSNSVAGNHWSTGAVTQSITVSASGTYTDTVTSGGCSAFSSGTIVTVNPNPPIPTITPNGPTTFCSGDSVKLTSSSAINNSWSNGALTQSITLYAAGTFTDTITSGGCSSHSTVTTITVNPTPATPVVTPSGPTAFCSGDSVILTSNTVANNFWSTGALTQSIIVHTSGTYTDTIRTGSCSSHSTPITVTITPSPAAPIISTNGPTTFCSGDSVKLTSSSSSNNFWNTGINTQSITVHTSGTFRDSVKAGGCTSATATATILVNPLPAAPTVSNSGPTAFCQGDSVTLTSNSIANNSWSTGATTQSITLFASGTYTDTISNGTCKNHSVPKIITVHPLPPVPTITASGATTICQGNSVTLTSSSLVNNSWSTGVKTASIVVSSGGSYTDTVRNGNGCVNYSAPVTVTVNPTPLVPTVTASGKTIFCLGDSVRLTSASPTNNIWNTGAITQSITVLASGVYTDTVRLGACISHSAGTVVSARPHPLIVTTAAVIDTAHCRQANGGITGIVISSGTQPYTYSWYASGRRLAGTGIALTHAGQDQYYLVVADSVGCMDSISPLFVPNTGGIILSLSATPIAGHAPMISNFTASSLPAFVNYNWNFGDGAGNTLAGNTISNNFTSKGIYRVTVMVTDHQGCADTASVLVTVDSLTTIQSPNVFSPNGDGVNDVFTLQVPGATTLKISFFNRWGAPIQELDGLQLQWDGRNASGIAVETGTYYYVAQYTTEQGEAKTVNGFVLLIR